MNIYLLRTTNTKPLTGILTPIPPSLGLFPEHSTSRMIELIQRSQVRIRIRIGKRIGKRKGKRSERMDEAVGRMGGNWLGRGC
jgi:hypothetical protein